MRFFPSSLPCTPLRALSRMYAFVADGGWNADGLYIGRTGRWCFRLRWGRRARREMGRCRYVHYALSGFRRTNSTRALCWWTPQNYRVFKVSAEDWVGHPSSPPSLATSNGSDPMYVLLAPPLPFPSPPRDVQYRSDGTDSPTHSLIHPPTPAERSTYPGTARPKSPTTQSTNPTSHPTTSPAPASRLPPTSRSRPRRAR